jgi:methionyl-tRNA synthetase
MPKTMKKMSKTIGFEVEKSKLDDVLQPAGKIKVMKPEVPFEKVNDEKIEEVEKVMLERIKKAEMKEDRIEMSIDEFKKFDLRIGKILRAEKIKGSKKLLRLEVDVGGEVRQIVAGIAEKYEPKTLVGKLVPVVVNMQSTKIMGIESKGMILAADVNGEPILLHPDREVPPGTKLK